MSISGNVVNVENFWWRYAQSKEWVLKGVSLHLEEGEVLGLIGPSGAGKSTLIKSLSAIIPHQIPGTLKGHVSIKDKVIHERAFHEIIKHVGVVFQDPDNQFITMSVQDEIVFGMENSGYPPSEMQRRLDNVTEFMKIGSLLDKQPFEISGGQKQKVAIASVLVLDPEILLLDEPTTDLDPASRSMIFEMIRELKKRGVSMIIVEHESDDLVKVADRMMLLSEGKIVSEGPTREFYSNIDLLEKYGTAPPQIAKTFSGLGVEVSPLPMTLEEGAAALGKLGLASEKLTEDIGRLPSRVRNGGNVAIELRDVEYVYDDGTRALSGVNLRIHKEDYVGIVGQNGSGKTTLAMHLNGLLKPSRGHVEVFGLDTKQMTTEKLVKYVGYCFQNPDHQLVENTVYREISIGPRKFGLPEDEVEKLTKQAISVMGLGGLEDEDPFYLGKGQRLRVAVATVLALNSEVIIVDEPTTGQDWKQSQELMNYLDHLNSIGKTIIVITHHMKYVAEHASRVVALTDGRIVLDDETRTAFANFEKLKEAQVEAPVVSKLFYQTGHCSNGKLPLSTDEARQLLTNALRHQ